MSTASTTGYICLLRSLLDWPLWNDDAAVKLLVYCLLHASYKTRTVNDIQLQPGQLLLSKRASEQALGWSRNKLRRHLQQLEDIHVIRVQSMHNYTLVTIPGWVQFASLNGSKDFTDAGSTADPKQYIGISTIGNNQGKKTFELFWAAYPARRYRKPETEQAYRDAIARGITHEEIMAALEAEKNTPQWTSHGGQFIPAPYRWLEGLIPSQPLDIQDNEVGSASWRY